MAKVSTQKSKTWNITFETVRPKIYWEWKLPYGNCCAICRNSVMELSAKTNDRTVCAPVVGVCGHTFHKDCITSWVNTKKINECPICKQYWQIKKIEEKKDSLEKKKEIMEQIKSLVNSSDNLNTPLTQESIQSMISHIITGDEEILSQSTQTNFNNENNLDLNNSNNDSVPELESDTDSMPELESVISDEEAENVD